MQLFAIARVYLYVYFDERVNISLSRSFFTPVTTCISEQFLTFWAAESAWCQFSDATGGVADGLQFFMPHSRARFSYGYIRCCWVTGLLWIGFRFRLFELFDSFMPASPVFQRHDSAASRPEANNIDLVWNTEYFPHSSLPLALLRYLLFGSGEWRIMNNTLWAIIIFTSWWFHHYQCHKNETIHAH